MSRRVQKTIQLRFPKIIENPLEKHVFPLFAPCAVRVPRKEYDLGAPPKLVNTIENHWFAQGPRCLSAERVRATIVAIARNYDFPETVENHWE